MSSNEALTKELDVIDRVQRYLWNLHHNVKTKDEDLANIIWVCSLQIESALRHINENVLGKDGYYGE